MSIQPVVNDTVAVSFNLQAFLSEAFTSIKNQVVSLANTVFTYLQETVWPTAQTLTQKAWTFFRTPAGFIAVGAAVGLGLAHLSTKVNSDEFAIWKGILQVAAVSAFIGTGVVIGLGIAYGFSAVLI